VKSKLENYKFQKSLFVFLAVAPAFMGYLIFTLYPNAMSIYYSLLKWDGISVPEFIGLKNYVTMISDRYVWRALAHNLILMVAVPPLTIIIALALSYVLSFRAFKGASFYKILYYMPNVLSSVVIAILWSFIYDGGFGLINAVLKLIGIDLGNYYWLGHKNTALLCMVAPSVWSGVGLYVVVFTNAMCSIPKSLHESAILDGASHFTRFSKITVPLISGVTRISTLFILVGSLKGFETIMVLTNGGPEGATDVIGLYMFNLAFGAEQSIHLYGYASAIGMFLFVILVGVRIVIDKFYAKETVEF
jgi:N-acetylglucosamine transport system permease protein